MRAAAAVTAGAPRGQAWAWARRILPFVGLTLTFVLLARFVDMKAALNALVSADLAWLFAAAVATLLAPVIVGWKLWIVVRIVDVAVPFSRCWSAVLAAVTLNAVLPGRGGDFVRAGLLADGPGSTSLLLGAVLLERLVDVFTLGLLALLASASGDAGVVPWLGAAACGAAVLAVVAMALGHRVPFKPELAERLGRAARRLSARPGLGALLVLTSLLSWLNNVGVLALCLEAVGGRVPLLALARAVPIAILAGIAPVTVGGIGTRDAALVALLARYGQPEAVVAAGLAYTALTSWFLAAFGLLALRREVLARARVARAQGAA
jgi:uncharacterized membrane protein YbhN (UPF0104 family)